MREILENPHGELIGCVLPKPIHVQRTFHDGERLTWEELEFTIRYTPGHADYHMGMFGVIDGHSVAFSGDNISPLNATPSLIYRNHVHKTSHQQTARIYMEYMPEILCTGHDLQREVKPFIYQNFARKAEEMTQLFGMLLPGEANFGLEPSWVQIYPYQSLARPGDTLDLQVRMTNFLDRMAQAKVELVLPNGWLSNPKSVELKLTPYARTMAPVSVHIPDTYKFQYPRIAITADVTYDGRKLGQIVEATVELRESG
jgi:hypothetical protein